MTETSITPKPDYRGEASVPFLSDRLAERVSRRHAESGRPITAIYSKSDGVVSWEAAIDRHSPNVRHPEVNVAQLGMGFNPTVWSHIVQALDAEVDRAAAR
jgi:L-rhamnose isomerase